MADDNKKHQNLSPEELKEFNQAWDELKVILESKDADSAASQEKIEKLDKTLDEYCAKSEEMLASINKEADERDELKKQIDELEAKISRVNVGSDDQEKVKAEAKAFELFLRKGPDDLKEEEKQLLRTDDDDQGGFYAPSEFVLEIIKKITEISQLRTVARVSRTSRGFIEVPTRETLMQARFRGEGGLLTVTNSTYGTLKINVHALDAITVATTHMLTDSAFDIASEMEADWLESSAQVEGNAFLNGDNVEEPEGFLTNTKVQIFSSGVANDFVA